MLASKVYKLYLTTQTQGNVPSSYRKNKNKNKKPNSDTMGDSFFGNAAGFSTNQNQKSSTQTMNARKGVYVVAPFNKLPPDPKRVIYILTTYGT